MAHRIADDSRMSEVVEPGHSLTCRSKNTVSPNTVPNVHRNVVDFRKRPPILLNIAAQVHENSQKAAT